jgi:hypothetical protein
MIPGEVTYYDAVQGNAGPERLFDIDLRLDHLWAKIAETKAGIEGVYMVDLFLQALADSRGTPPTAEEVRARLREKLQILGPVHERKAPETLAPSVERVAAIMVRASMGAWAAGEDGLLPQPPPALIRDGRLAFRIEFISEVAQAQKLVGLDALERFSAFVIRQAVEMQDPSVLDNYDADDGCKQYGEMVGVNPTVRRSDDERAAIRAKRAQDTAIAQAVEAAPNVAGAVKDLSQAQTDEPSALSGLLARAGP